MANNNNFHPNIMQQLYQMYQEGKLPNMSPNNNQGESNGNGFESSNDVSSFNFWESR